ncbi:MAG TPA: hypothetical protein VEP90_20405 [Methylomirabilota bacterium]|nr:hypothetical protein [Methylomirabilota bacterium]
MQRSKQERIAHLNLNEKCLERGGFSTKFCGVLAEGLNTTIPEYKTDNIRVHLCHACHNAKCSNIKHLYWGTPQENYLDGMACGRIKSTWESTIKKYGYNKALNMIRKAQKKANKRFQKKRVSTNSAVETYKL